MARRSDLFAQEKAFQVVISLNVLFNLMISLFFFFVLFLETLESKIHTAKLL